MVLDRSEHPVENNEYRRLDEEWKTRPEWIYLFSFVELHELHPHFCLVSLELCLKSYDLWLYCLHLTSRYEHLMLRHEEDDPHYDRDRDDRESERVTGEILYEPNKRVKNRGIKYSRE